jgi:hypothetical protein
MNTYLMSKYWSGAGYGGPGKADHRRHVGLADLPGPRYPIHRVVSPTRLKGLQSTQAELVCLR